MDGGTQAARRADEAGSRLWNAWRGLSLRQVVWGGVALVLLMALLGPYAWFLLAWSFPLPLALGAAVAGWLPRRRLVDACVLGVPVWAAAVLEPRAAPELLVCLALPLFALTLRPRFSILLAGVLVLTLRLAIEMKQRFAGTPLSWPDLQFFFAEFRGNVGVFATQPTLLAYAAGALLLLAGVVAGGWRWDVPGERRVAIGARCAAVALSLVAVGWCVQDLAQSSLDLHKRGVFVVELHPLPLARFLATTHVVAAWQPRPADTTRFRQIAQKVHAVGAAAPAIAPADIVVFLQESQFNPRTLSGCPESLCGMAEFDAGAGTAAFGPMRVHTFGGGTWLSEFAAATGVPHDAFGVAGTYATFNIAGGVRRSFVRSLKQAGYRTVAVYPVTGRMMNARQAYEGYGFDRFYDSADAGLHLGYATPDRKMHEVALKILAAERKHGKPVYLFVVTIFNHSQHGVRMERVPQDLQHMAEAAFPEEDEAQNVADYVWRTREFQRAMAATRQTLLQPAARPTVLAWFGDHQPGFGSALSVRDRVRSSPASGGRIPVRYQTWYRVDTNVRQAKASGPQPLDIVFLPGVLAEAAGVPLDDWLAANVAARRECASILTECARPQARDAYLAYLHDDLKAFAFP
jgi:hypothetical protein